MIYKLVYFSQESFKFTEPTLKDLLKVSRENNAKNNITGVFIYSQGDIVQILEGDEKNVKELYEKIIDDKRHTNLRLLIKGESKIRNFPDWFMGFKSLDENTYSAYLEQNNFLEKINFKDFMFNQEKPIETIIELVNGKYDFS